MVGSNPTPTITYLQKGVHMSPKDFKIKRTVRGDYVLIRLSNNTHGHFRHEKGCYDLINLLVKGILPSSAYYRVCAKRLLTADEFAQLRDKLKPKYINRR
jgi:hypothetical protein